MDVPRLQWHDPICQPTAAREQIPAYPHDIQGNAAMNTATCKGLYTQSWKELYRAAIHESDMDKLPERITDAESALVIRMRELFYSSEHKFEEEEGIDYALSILHALRSSLNRRSSTITIRSTGSLDHERSASSSATNRAKALS
jgi:hypothetical protein